MKILALADIASQKPLKQIFLENSDIELVITLGDLEQSDILYLEEITTIPKIGVYGNHCSKTYFEPLGITNLHCSAINYKNYSFGGFEGCVRYKESSYAAMYSQEEAQGLLKNFPYVDIFIAHCPPFGINDQADPAHIGFEAIKDYLERGKPQHFFHGHTYPKQEELITQYGDTQIHYVHGYQVVEI